MSRDHSLKTSMADITKRQTKSLLHHCLPRVAAQDIFSKRLPARAQVACAGGSGATRISCAPGSGGDARPCPRQRRKRSRPERSPVAAGASGQPRALALGRPLLPPRPWAARGLLRAGRCPTRASCGTSSRGAGWHRPGTSRLRRSRPRPLPRPLPRPTRPPPFAAGCPAASPILCWLPRGLSYHLPGPQRAPPRSLPRPPRPPPSPAPIPAAAPDPCPDPRGLPRPLPRPPRRPLTPAPTDAAAPIPCRAPRGLPRPLPDLLWPPLLPAGSLSCVGPFPRCRVRHCRPEVAATGFWARLRQGEGLQGACLGKAETDCPDGC
ncbi:keratinocyte proline-rich protein-like [Pongo pygmaeus]|uniref:keratinocyte proline-rich protein-like n=1 Tax=Pongo pygmaeus TaxID=9600 RepID=UPI00300CFAC8